MIKYISFISILVFIVFSSFVKVSSSTHSFQNTANFGFIERGDSIEFRFGEQKKIQVGLMEFDLDKRRSEIKQVNLAGDFNNWNPKNANFALKKVSDKVFSLVLSKKSLGQKGETRKFKFVLNGVYWIEPPQDAQNKITGADHNTNLFIKL